ncbi:MAG: hypothetical protein ACXQS4_02020 [Methermicoccaceae archaeon]
MTTTDEVMPSVQRVLGTIESREAVYRGTWKCVSLQDLLAVARVKTLRASEGISEDGLGEQVVDDVVDATAYLLFALAKLERMREITEE